MSHEKHSKSTIDRLAHSKGVRVAAGLLALTLAGCSAASSASSSRAPRSNRPADVAVGSRTPGPTPTTSRPAPAPTSSKVPLSEMCQADSSVISKAFNLSGAEAACTVPSTPDTPGMPVLRWDVGNLSIIVDKTTGFHGQLIKKMVGVKGIETFKVDGSSGIVEPDVARVDVGLPDGNIAQMEVQGPTMTRAEAVPDLVAAASILLSFNGINPYSTPLGG